MEDRTQMVRRTAGPMSDEKISIPMNRYETLIKNEFLLQSLLNAAYDCSELSYSGDRLNIDSCDFTKTLVALVPEPFKKRLRELQDERLRKQKEDDE